MGPVGVGRAGGETAGSKGTGGCVFILILWHPGEGEEGKGRPLGQQWRRPLGLFV